MSRRYTMWDLWRLCNRYVPDVARHDSSWPSLNPAWLDVSGGWWPAHELGHLLVASKREIRDPIQCSGWVTHQVSRSIPRI